MTKRVRYAAVVVAVAGLLWGVGEARWFLNYRALQATWEEIPRLGAALELHRDKYGGYPAGDGPIDIIGKALAEWYPEFDRVDGWGGSLHYAAKPSVGRLAKDYTIVSSGADGVEQVRRTSYPVTNYFDCDLVYHNGHWMQSPVASVDDGSDHASFWEAVRGRVK